MTSPALPVDNAPAADAFYTPPVPLPAGQLAFWQTKKFWQPVSVSASAIQPAAAALLLVPR